MAWKAQQGGLHGGLACGERDSQALSVRPAEAPAVMLQSSAGMEAAAISFPLPPEIPPPFPFPSAAVRIKEPDLSWIRQSPSSALYAAPGGLNLKPNKSQERATEVG